MIELLFVVLYEKEQRLEVVVRDATGRRRKVDITWHSKDPTPVPAGWFSQVQAELQLQDDEEKAKASGRVLF